MDDIVIVDNLHYAYPPLTPGGEPIPVLKGVNLRVRRGEFLALMGPTGVGKSTLCLTLNGILPHLMGGTLEGLVVVASLYMCPKMKEKERWFIVGLGNPG